jgi:phosphoribosylformylglycinamidine cyclo-ligase
VKPVLALLREIDVKGMAHITGGGLLENTHRMFPDALCARLQRSAWPRPPIFDWLQRAGNVDDAEMHRVFNCGIGMILVVARDRVAAALEDLRSAGETPYVIGAVEKRVSGAPGTIVE